MANIDNGFIITGIKQVESKDHTRVFTTYYCDTIWSAYEQENSMFLQGHPVEIVQTSENFPIRVGDVVVFYYGKARGDWQPVVDYKLLGHLDAEPAADKPAEKAEKK